MYLRYNTTIPIQIQTLSRDQLIQLVRNTGEKTTLILRGINTRPTEELIEISRNSSTGTVIFVFD